MQSTKRTPKEKPLFRGSFLGWLLIVSVQPLANIVADYTCHNGDCECSYVILHAKHLPSVAIYGSSSNYIICLYNVEKQYFILNFFIFCWIKQISLYKQSITGTLQVRRLHLLY